MCGRFATTNDFNKITNQFGAVVQMAALAPSFNVAPTRIVPVVTYVEAIQRREVSLMKWGLVPFWAKDEKIARNQTNARAETIAQKPAFKNSFKERRCIIPADGFFEWQVETRDPYFISSNKGDMLGLAGIWDKWKNPAGDLLHSFAIITCEPNPLVAPIHDRMPVIIEAYNYLRWLSPSLPPDDAKTLLKPYPAEHMQAWMVSKKVGNPRNDSPENLLRLNSL